MRCSPVFATKLNVFFLASEHLCMMLCYAMNFYLLHKLNVDVWFIYSINTICCRRDMRMMFNAAKRSVLLNYRC